MYSAEIVSKYVIMRCNHALNRTISNLKLQKILYFIQAEFLVVKKEACFPERIEAWDFGPVIPKIYRLYKKYGSASIPYISDDCNKNLFPFSQDDRVLINGIIDKCSEYSASSLAEITHCQSPWKNAYHSHFDSIITNESIRNFFIGA